MSINELIAAIKYCSDNPSNGNRERFEKLQKSLIIRIDKYIFDGSRYRELNEMEAILNKDVPPQPNTNVSFETTH